MARRSTLAVVATVAALLLPASAVAATAPTNAPQLTSAPYTLPVTLHWTPGNDGDQHRRKPCSATRARAGRQPAARRSPRTRSTPRRTTRAETRSWPTASTATTSRPQTSRRPPTVPASPSWSTRTTRPRLSPSRVRSAGVVTGTVTVTGSGADAVSGVASGVLHAGSAGACPAGPAIPSSWDTTAVANGVYDVCNVVTDNAGHVAIATVTVTVKNALPPPPPPPRRVTGVPRRHGHGRRAANAPKAPTKSASSSPAGRSIRGRCA